MQTAEVAFIPTPQVPTYITFIRGMQIKLTALEADRMPFWYLSTLENKDVCLDKAAHTSRSLASWSNFKTQEQEYTYPLLSPEGVYGPHSSL